MKHIWSPWRMKYIQRDKQIKGCVFCDVLMKPDGPENEVIYRSKSSYAILNRYPYTSGHLMIVPNDHKSSLDLLGHDTRSEMMELTAFAVQVLGEVYHPEGYNVGINIGEAAGAGIADHIHIHIVPRWNGDTNFMSSVGEIRVLPESLDDTYYRILTAWQTLLNIT